MANLYNDHYIRTTNYAGAGGISMQDISKQLSRHPSHVEMVPSIVNISFSGGGGSGASATSIISSPGLFQGVTILDGGSGYTSPPTVTITDTGNHGSGASCTAVVAGGKVTGVTSVVQGSGFRSPLSLRALRSPHYAYVRGLNQSSSDSNVKIGNFADSLTWSICIRCYNESEGYNNYDTEDDAGILFESDFGTGTYKTYSAVVPDTGYHTWNDSYNYGQDNDDWNAGVSNTFVAYAVGTDTADAFSMTFSCVPGYHDGTATLTFVDVGETKNFVNPGQPSGEMCIWDPGSDGVLDVMTVGSVTSITLNDGGSGYVDPPTATITTTNASTVWPNGPKYTGSPWQVAVLGAVTVSSAGRVTKIVLGNTGAAHHQPGGAYHFYPADGNDSNFGISHELPPMPVAALAYTYPTVTGGGGSGFAGAFKWHKESYNTAGIGYPADDETINAVVITNGGSGYAPDLTVNLIGGNGFGATATAQYDSGTGQVTGVTLTDGGYNYTSAPTVEIRGGRPVGTGVEATATATIG